MRTPTWRVAALLFASGCCALIYQIGWLREFRLIFGASTAASAAVLAVFIGGLGAGGLLLGHRADRHPRPLLFYAQLESLVALSAAASPFLLALVRQLYLAGGGTVALGLTLGTVVRLGLTALVLAVPTILMGGTLPAAARAVTRRADVRRQDVAALYGLNTLGAVVGCLMSTFFMLEVFGTRNTLWLAAAVNLLVAMIARQLDRSTTRADDAPAAEVTVRLKPDTTEGVVDSPLEAPVAFVLIASAVVGFAFFLMELVWYRMLGPLLGGSVFTFGLILALALLGIGIGGLLYALVGAARRPTLAGFAMTCVIEGVAVAVPYALGDRLAIFAIVLLPLGHLTFSAHMAAWTVVAAAVVLIPAMVAGYQFPMLIALFGRGRERVGRQVGLVYAANTVGAIVGSLAGGFGLLPWLTAPGAWRFVVVSLAALGASAAAMSAARGSRRQVLAPAFMTVAAIALALAPGPTAVWRHSGIGAGRAAVAIESANQLRDWSHTRQRSILREGDGVESAVALGVEPAGYSFLVNGKSDGGARSDASTQVMLGLTGALLHPQARRSLVIGLGTGSTAGWLGAIPSMERVEVVELEPLVLEVARACTDVNLNVLENPKVRVTIGDAREALLTTRDRFDLIASEPSNPFRAGVASLFTQEYYQAANNRLTDDGLFIQWVQAYEIDARTFRTVYATMASVFPHLEAWQGAPNDVFLVGTKRPLVYSAATLSARIQEEPFKTALRNTWRATDVHGVLAHFVAGDEIARTIAQESIELNTDDRNLVEFGYGRAVGATHRAVVSDLRDLAKAYGVDRPAMADTDGVNWSAVDTAWVSFLGSELSFPEIHVEESPIERARRVAIVQFYRNRNLPAAREAWAEAGEAPRDRNELAMAAALDADAGLDSALSHIDAIRVYDAGEAEALLATLRFRQGRDEEAAAALEAAFHSFRTDPWTLLRFKEQAVGLTRPLADRTPALARRLFDALQPAFSLQSLESDRLVTAAFLSRRADFRGLCRDAIGRLEPKVPWTVDFLAMRRSCYEMVGDPRLAVATRELTEYLAREPLPLAAGLPAP
ncbi:MAG: fused MFS/spermidine synthase [Acidobacteria bacterium]|nr:fused MFS/spermidine synthase [Acidobacteriota bacterium]